MTIIAFVGSVFSPIYAAARRRKTPADPEQHCCINVALYGPDGNTWVYSEYGKDKVRRSADEFVVGSSRLFWEGDELVVEFDERTAVFGKPVKGKVRLRPRPLVDHRIELDPDGRHVWCGVAPHAQVEVDIEQPALSFRGSGYHDSNYGSEPLEDGFASWTWSRTELGGRSAVLYDVVPRRGEPKQHGIMFEADGTVGSAAAHAEVELPPTGTWKMPRATRADPGAEVEVQRTLEDTPFYSRSLLQTGVAGIRGPAVHESIDLDRFSRRIVQLMLRFKLRRG